MPSKHAEDVDVNNFDLEEDEDNEIMLNKLYLLANEEDEDEDGLDLYGEDFEDFSEPSEEEEEEEEDEKQSVKRTNDTDSSHSKKSRKN